MEIAKTLDAKRHVMPVLLAILDIGASDKGHPARFG